MEIRQLQYFVESARTRSFSQAARRLFTSQPNISKSIQQLETELETSLFTRNSTGIELTAEGKIVYLYAVNILQNVNRMNELLDEQRNRQSTKNPPGQ